METPVALNTWYPILASKTLKARKALGVKRLGVELVLWRDSGGQVNCFEDRCCHRRVKLSPGRIVNDRIECFYHGFQYDQQGKVIYIPALGSRGEVPEKMCVRKFQAEEKHGFIWLWWGDDEPVPLSWFDDPISESGISVQSSSIFPANYLAIIENFHDIHHVPITHKSYAGGFGEKVVDFNLEKATKGLSKIKASLSKDKDNAKKYPFELQILFPTTLLLKVNANMHLIGVATPVDDQNTWFYGRYYQRYTRIPLLGHFISWLLLFFDWYLLQRFQDLPRWQAQRPLHIGKPSGYHLIEADKGIAAYYSELKKSLER